MPAICLKKCLSNNNVERDEDYEPTIVSVVFRCLIKKYIDNVFDVNVSIACHPLHDNLSSFC
jgi:hypothetical protein